MRAKPQSCAGCACEKHGTDFSAIEGTGSSGVLLCGEASGEHEQRDQLPFRPFAPAGGVLQRTIRRMGMAREQFSITNVLRCRPRNNWLESSPWEYSALRHCRSNLDAAVAERRPKVIVALGGIALRELTGMAGEAQGISHLAGYVLPGPQQIPTIGNFHPAFLRRGKASYQGIFARILQRAMNIAAGRDTNWLWGIDPEEQRTHGILAYNTRPSLDDAYGYLRKLQSSGGATVSYDLETFESGSLDEDARDGFVDTNIRLIQFSSEIGEGLAFPWDWNYRTVAQQILHLPNVKCGHNVWLFDDKVLRAAGEREGLDLRPRGTIHDTLQMFHHWQPDLPAHLQFCSQYVLFPFPWKHLAASNLAFYGCCDVDATLRLYNFLATQLHKEQLWGDHTLGYLGQVASVRPVLERMEERGLPVDDAARLKLDAEFDAAQSELGTELARLAPPECRRVHPKQGYKGIPPVVKARGEDVYELIFKDPGDDPEFYHYEQRSFPVAIVDPDSDEPVISTTTRWCRVYDFNPNSWQQLIAYMRAKKHPVPKSKEEDDDGNQKDTTNKKELQRLARRTGDTFYLKVIEYRELSKMRGTYIEGFRPHPDTGRVHTTFTFDTGTGQLTSRNPNVQNFPKHGRLAKPVRAMVAAPAGHLIVEADFKSYHVLATGFEAEDPSYMRMARLDMHSFIAGCVLKLWGPEIMEESDAVLLDRFRWFKSDPVRKRVRDKQAKPTILGVGFGMGYRRLYQENLEHFPDERTAKRFLSALQELFPKVFEWQARVRKVAHEQQYLKSRFGHIRRFYEVFRWDNKKGDWAPGDQAEEAVAFLPANHAFGNIRETMKDLERKGLNEKFGTCNNVHDSLVNVFRKELLDDYLTEFVPVLRAPSRILTHPTLAPNGLTVDVEVCFGQNWAELEQIDLPVTSAPTILAPPMEATAQ